VSSARQQRLAPDLRHFIAKQVRDLPGFGYACDMRYCKATRPSVHVPYIHPKTFTQPASLLCAFALSAVLLAGCGQSAKSGGAPRAATNATIALSDCRIKDFDGVARCAQVTVPENATKPDGKRVEIFVAVLPSLTPQPEPDPLFLFAGGPGQAASDMGRLAGMMSSIRKSRDIVLVDQRGTGKSKTLTCDLSTENKNKDPLTESLNPDAQAVEKDWARCIATIKGEPSLHRTDDFIADLELVRKGLGLAAINVWGGSYGSRVALRYMKLHPQSIRSAVLDGVAPTTLRLPDDAMINSEAELKNALAACTASPACAKAYPNVAETLDQLLTKLRTTPQTITLQHPATGKTVSGIATDRTLIGFLWPLLYQPEAARLIPKLISDAAQGNYASLAATTSGQNMADADISTTQRFAVMCAEDMLGRNAPTVARFQSLSDLFYGFCKTFPHGKVEPEFFEATRSDIPTLLLSGSLDPVTPPASGSLAAKTLSQSKHIIVSGMGHIVSPHACVRRVMNRFIEAGNITAATDTCESELNLPRPHFYVSALEARP
jgi:pimeloyl-ACP methyl ester carboxylesterase